MSILAIIPARQDSKRCPGKNMRIVDNMELFKHTLYKLYWTNELFTKICITSDDNLILKNQNLEHKYCFDLIKRPKVICMDDSTEFEFIEHALQWYEKKGITFDDVAVFYPTTPFKKIETIKEILDQWEKDKIWATQLRTVKEIRWEPEKVWSENKNNSFTDLINRAIDFRAYTRQYKQVPYCYIYKVNRLNNLVHYFYQPVSKFVINDPIESHDINTELDFKIAEWIVKDKLNE